MIEIEKQEINALRLEVLSSVRDFCEQSGLQYFLAHSSLLGAIRDKSFIPWNLNASIMLRREEYESFSRLFNEWSATNTPKLKVISAHDTPDYGLPFIRVINTDTVLVEKNGFGPSVNVAVFPIDGMGNNRKEAEKRIKKIETLTAALMYKTYGRSPNIMRSFGARLISRLNSKGAIVKKIDGLCKKSTVAESSLLAVPFGTNAVRAIMSRDVFDTQEKAELEGELFAVPIGYDRYLKALYGDYMSLPAETERKEKEYRVFKKNKEINYGTETNC